MHVMLEMREASLRACVQGMFDQFASPLSEGLADPITGVIYAFALWEAAKFNQPVELVFNGPFRVGAAGPASLKPEGVADGLTGHPPRRPLCVSCPSCGGEVAPGLLSCPSCHRLVHADRLKELAEAAESSERAGEVSAALGAWRRPSRCSRPRAGGIRSSPAASPL